MTAASAVAPGELIHSYGNLIPKLNGFLFKKAIFICSYLLLLCLYATIIIGLVSNSDEQLSSSVADLHLLALGIV